MASMSLPLSLDHFKEGNVWWESNRKQACYALQMAFDVKRLLVISSHQVHEVGVVRI